MIAAPAEVPPPPRRPGAGPSPRAPECRAGPRQRHLVAAGEPDAGDAIQLTRRGGAVSASAREIEHHASAPERPADRPCPRRWPAPRRWPSGRPRSGPGRARPPAPRIAYQRIRLGPAAHDEQVAAGQRRRRPEPRTGQQSHRAPLRNATCAEHAASTKLRPGPIPVVRVAEPLRAPFGRLATARQTGTGGRGG